MAGTGNITMPCVAVTGLTDWEMPKESFLVMEVEGLCVGGFGVNNKNQQVDCVLYCKGKPNAEVDRFLWIIQNIFTPFVQDQWLEYSGYDAEQDGAIPKKEFVVSYCDGDNSQLKAILANVNHYSANGIIANKHNTSRSSVEHLQWESDWSWIQSASWQTCFEGKGFGKTSTFYTTYPSERGD